METLTTESNCPREVPRPKVTAEKYQELVHYLKYASSAYAPMCPKPNGNTLVFQICNPLTDIQGFIARDSDRREIIVALRGSLSITDILIDSCVLLVPFIAPDVSAPNGARVHSGFLLAWNSIALLVLKIVSEQISKHPEFAIVTVGHSLGGSVALLAAVSLQQRYPQTCVRTYSYGAPRTGNKVFAEFVNESFGKKAHRVVHMDDGVPTAIPTTLGYHHHGVEYWQYDLPPSENTTVECSPGGEDPCCSACIPTHGANSAHRKYFDIYIGTPFCVSILQVEPVSDADVYPHTRDAGFDELVGEHIGCPSDLKNVTNTG